MKCHQCGFENSKTSKFCRNCGTPLGGSLRCAQCATDNPGDSIFCMECGERLPMNRKAVKGTQRKCRNCGHFNELDALFCVVCGEEISHGPKKSIKRQSEEPSSITIALVIVFVLITAFFAKKVITIFQREEPSRVSSSYVPPRISMSGVDESDVIAVARNFKCACGGCGELPLETCECDMPKGSVEEKNFIREKLAEGLTVEQIIELLDKKYGHRI